jgi:hypothetical protein
MWVAKKERANARRQDISSLTAIRKASERSFQFVN